jgi:hypothetical protein
VSDFWNNLAEGANEVSNFITDNTGAVGDFVEDKGEAFMDFITPDAETGTFTSAPPSGNKFYTPIHWDGLENQPSDIRRKIDDLYNPFLDMYQREYGKAKWLEYAGIISQTQEQTVQDHNTLNNSILGNTSARSITHPVKPSPVLPYYVPREATDAEQQAIDEQAKSDTTSAIDQLHTAFFEVIDDGSMSDMDAMLQGFSSGMLVLDELITTHESQGFARLSRLSEYWVGDDADTFAEKFGARLRPGVGLQRAMGCSLLAAAIGEFSLRLTILEQLGKVLDGVLAQVDALTTGTEPYVKIVAKFAFNRIPFGSDVLTGLDAIGEYAGGDEAADDAASAAVGNWLRALEFEYEVPITSQQGSSMLSELLAAAERAKTDLKTGKDILNENLGIDLGTYRALYGTDPQVLIPGEKEA